MNLRQTTGKSRLDADSEINITPVMNIFVILIPFLLLTATFVKIAIIDLALPSLEQGSSMSNEEIKDLTVLVISIGLDGFEIKTSENKYPLIKLENGKYDLQKLKGQLVKIKKQYPRLEDVIIDRKSVV